MQPMLLIAGGSRWVLKWKWVKAEKASNYVNSQDSMRVKDDQVRVIRARLIVRGFKDAGKHEGVANYAGTASRYSQRIVTSEAACQVWDLFTLDIPKAFLQGFSHKEMEEIIGEKPREVNFYLLSQPVNILKQLDGISDFDPFNEVLHCDKPGTGLIDAPRAFRIQLGRELAKLSLRSTSVDNELFMLHEDKKCHHATRAEDGTAARLRRRTDGGAPNLTKQAEVPDEDSTPVGPAEYDDNLKAFNTPKEKRLLVIMAIHVEDLRIAGEPEEVDEIIKHLEAAFGTSDVTRGTFTNCGVRHRQNPDTKAITTDQTEYIKDIKTINHPDMRNVESDADCSEAVHKLYMSLVGAVACCLITRLDVAVYVVALQRFLQKPKIIHIKRLNTVVRYMQRILMELHYNKLKGNITLVMYSDSVFKKEDDTGHALKGALFLRIPTSDLPSSDDKGLSKLEVDPNKNIQVHVLDYMSRPQKHVTRSTFSSELFGACDTQDHGFLIATILHQVAGGVTSADEAIMLREQGGWLIPMVLVLDAYSAFSATTATQVKVPADSPLLAHIQYLREFLDKGILKALWWSDTRDMIADGFAKGAIDIEALHNIMKGDLQFTQTIHSWTSRLVKLK